MIVEYLELLLVTASSTSGLCFLSPGRLGSLGGDECSGTAGTSPLLCYRSWSGMWPWLPMVRESRWPIWSTLSIWVVRLRSLQLFVWWSAEK